MKNTIKWLVVVSMLLVVVMSFALISCGGNGDDTDTDTNQNGVTNYTVTFKQADGTEEKVTVEAGKSATAPALKQVDGYTVAWDNTDLSNISADITVTAVKTPVEYTISYELNGGTNSADNVDSYTIESATVLLSNPSRSGYKFLGWYSDAEFTTKVEEIAAGSKGNKSLYANWEAVTYTIKYELGGGTNNPGNPATYDITAADIVLKPASLSGYDFAGWYLDQAFTKPCDKIAAGSTGNITLYAQYDLERFAINYNVDGGKNDKDNPADYNREETVVFLDPKKNGFAFKGWFSDREFTTPIEGIEKGTTGIVTVYAKWEIVTYNVEYVIPDGLAEANPSNPSSYTVESVQALEAPLNVKPGYTFDGWFIEGAYVNQIEEINSTFGYNKFYAKFTPIVYDITYDAKGGSISDENPINYTVENVGENKLAIIASERNGYKFLGWYLNAEYTGEPVTEVPASTIGGISLFAKWEIITYNITYVLNGGTNADSNKATYTVESNVTFADPTKADTYLIGWFKDEALTEAIKSTNGLAEDITVYARWWDKQKDPTMKFDTSLVESAVANEENARKDNGMDIFDGNKVAPGIWNGGSYWAGKVGEKLTITLKEEVSIAKINAYVTGNWTLSNLTCYDVDGNEVAKGGIRAQVENEKVENVINLEQAVKVKTIVIEIMELKWFNEADGGAKTHKIGEIEIFVANPDYDPAA